MASKATFQRPSLLSSPEDALPDDRDRDGPRNVALLAMQPPDAAASPRIFYWIQSP